MEVEPPPTKVVNFGVNVTVNARIRMFDFEGRSDGYSVKKILAQVLLLGARRWGAPGNAHERFDFFWSW